MSSLKQQQANRLNSQKSTGPRTLRGKAVSRFNALKTGIDAESQIIPGEDPVALANLAEAYQQRWEPSLPEELVLVDTLAHDDWQLRRLRKAEAVHWRYRLREDSYARKYESEHRDGCGGNDFARLQRRMDSTERSYRLTLEKLECLAESGADLPVCLPESVKPSQPASPICPPAPAPVQEPTGLHEPQPLPNQPSNPGIGFVPSTPAATSARPPAGPPRPYAPAVSIPGFRVAAGNHAPTAPKPPFRA